MDASSTPFDAAARKACEGINNAEAALWANRECHKDPKFTNSQRIQIREQIKVWEDDLSRWETIYKNLTMIGATCPCLTDSDICNQGIRTVDHQSRAIGQQSPTIAPQQQMKQQTQAGQGASDCAHLNDNPWSNRVFALNEGGQCECVPTSTDPCVASE